jgi:hypothetical protein
MNKRLTVNSIYLSTTLLSSDSGRGGESSTVGNLGNGRVQGGGLGDFGSGGGGGAATLPCFPLVSLFLFNDILTGRKKFVEMAGVVAD